MHHYKPQENISLLISQMAWLQQESQHCQEVVETKFVSSSVGVVRLSPELVQLQSWFGTALK